MGFEDNENMGELQLRLSWSKFAKVLKSPANSAGLYRVADPLAGFVVFGVVTSASRGWCGSCQMVNSSVSF